MTSLGRTAPFWPSQIENQIFLKICFLFTQNFAFPNRAKNVELALSVKIIVFQKSRICISKFCVLIRYVLPKILQSLLVRKVKEAVYLRISVILFLVMRLFLLTIWNKYSSVML